MNPSTIVIGAGPYGLAVAAHLRHRGVPTTVVGMPMAFWRGMPSGMFLKSSWSASSLSDPARAFSLDRYVDEMGVEAPQPIPLGFFIDYCGWFQRNAVGTVDTSRVTCVRRDGSRFRVELTDGRVLDADRVVIAAGIAKFAHLPGFAEGLPPHRATHTPLLDDPPRFHGAPVAVIRAGQRALESR